MSDKIHRSQYFSRKSIQTFPHEITCCLWCICFEAIFEFLLYNQIGTLNQQCKKKKKETEIQKINIVIDILK